jgi:hypothetical protein
MEMSCRFVVLTTWQLLKLGYLVRLRSLVCDALLLTRTEVVPLQHCPRVTFWRIE